MSLLDKLKKNSTIKEANVLSKSKFFNEKDVTQTSVPAINIAFSGSLNGGFPSGCHQFVGESKSFKTGFSLLCAKSYMEKYPDAVMLFYDSEFGTPQSYFKSFDIDLERVLHTPITNIEILKFDIMKQLDNIERGEHIIIIIDSIGNLASAKEVNDALEEKGAADLSRPKQLKSLFRMVTPHLTIKDIPMIVVNHSYKTMELYAKNVVGGGCVVAGTKITMSTGELKTVESISVGELVRTLGGDKSVTSTWNPDTLIEGEPECFEVEFEDGFVVTCSDKHKFLINGEWVEARDLIVGMESAVY